MKGTDRNIEHRLDPVVPAGSRGQPLNSDGGSGNPFTAQRYGGLVGIRQPQHAHQGHYHDLVEDGVIEEEISNTSTHDRRLGQIKHIHTTQLVVTYSSGAGGSFVTSQPGVEILSHPSSGPSSATWTFCVNFYGFGG